MASTLRFAGRLLLRAAAAIAAGPAAGEDWPEWRGPARDGTSRETGWLAAWPEGGEPVVEWRAAVGKGHAAVSVGAGRAVTAGWDGGKDTVTSFDAATGAVRWRQSYPCETILQWPGPRATPAIDGDRVYALGQHGQLNAFDAGSGRLIWSVALAAGYNPDVDYGFAWSPLIEGDLLILAAGKRGLALRKRDGSFAWGDDGQHGACASPVRYVDAAGRRAVALITTDPGRNGVSLVGVEPESGAELWRHPGWPEKWGAACVDLLVHDNKVFVTTAEQNQRCARFTIRQGGLVEDWSNRSLASYTGGCVLVGGRIFGVNKNGILKCLDWQTGKEQWAQRGFDGHGTLIAADGKLIVQTSRSGELVIVEAGGGGYRELRRFKVFSGEPDSFTAPVLANGRIYCRSYAGEVVCLRVARSGE